MGDKYNDALKFWNSAFEMDDNAKEQYKREVDPEKDWKELASSEKLRDVIIEQLSNKAKVLDYGCAEGWAGISLRKSGCKDVTCVDVVENAIKLTEFFEEIFDIREGFKAECVSSDWIKETAVDVYDGVFCSNVIDVLPEDVASVIIENISRIAVKGAKIVIAMNYYAELKSNPEKNMEVKNGNELYVNGILRLVSRTDDEWKSIFEKYFDVEKIEYFAWSGETEEKRRIFIMKNR